MMTEESICVLKECSSGCKMAIESMNQVLEYVDDDSLKQLIEKSCKKHEQLENRAAKALADQGFSEKEPNKIAEAFSYISTQMKMMMNRDSRQIAKIMTDGCNMGIQSILEVLHKNPSADPESEAIARSLVKTEEDFMKELKPFL